MNYFNNINLNQNELQKAVMHPLAQPPADPKQGQMYFNTGNKKLYYYNDTKWVAVNDIDLSNYATIAQLNNKLDKQTTTDSNTQVYAVTGDTQKMINATSAATENTVVLRDANGKLQVAAGAVAADAVNKGQMDAAIAGCERTSNKVGTITDPGNDTQYPNTKAVVNYVKSQVSKVKDVTLDGTSIVDTETGVVALESTYSLTLDGTSGTLTQEQYDNLSGDDASYIWYTQTGVQPIRLTKVMSGEGSLQYQAVVSDTVMAVIIQFDKTWKWEFAQFNVENAANKKTTIEGNGNATDYPSTSAVVGYAAPIAHAVAGTTYGVGTTQKYGHVKLVTGDMNGKANVDGQVPSLDHTHSQYAELAGAAFTGSVTIGGNLTVNGTTTTVESETLKVKDQLIEVASGNTAELSSPAGLVVPKYDGTNNGALVFDKTGTAYVGDVVLNADGFIDVANSDLVALAGRAKTIAGGNLVKWDKATQTFVDAGIAASNLATVDDIPTASDYLTSTSDEQVISNGVNKKLGGSSDFKIRLVDTSAFKITDSTNSDNLLFSVVRGLNSMASPNRVYINAPLAIGSNTSAVGTAGQVLTSQGDGKAPQWTTLTIPQGTVKKFVRDFIGKNTDLEFSFEHKLGTDQCTVSLYKLNDSNNYEMVMADIILTTTNVIIKFAQAPTTTDSFRVVVTG